jgi:hypothetical protein
MLKWMWGRRKCLLKDDEIVCRSPNGSEETIRTSEIGSWLDYGDPWIVAIPINLTGGREVEWFDNNRCELETILVQVAPEKCRTA